MKKSLLMSAAFLAASTAVMAQNGLTLLPNPTDVYTMGFALSADGKYVAGRYSDDVTVFVTDWKAGTTVTATTDEAEEYSYINNVSNLGTGAGYVGTQAGWLKADGTTKFVGDSSIVKDVTNADDLFVGNEYHNDLMYTHACLWDAEGNRTMLPEPTDEWAGFAVSGTSAEFVTDDKSVIVGYMIDDFYTCPLLVWHLNRDTQTYSADPSLTKKYFAAGWDTEHPYTLFMPTGLSNNGQWIALTVQDQDYNAGVARYDLVNDTLEVCMSDNPRLQMQSTGIADDGTLIGYTSSEAIYWKAGEAQYTSLAEAFPNAEKLAAFDEQGDHAAFAISADGRYILGQGYQEPADEEQYYNDLFSYVLDTEDDGTATGIEMVEKTNAATSASSAVKARYNLRGQRVSANNSGLQIVRMTDGRVRKQIVK